MWINLRKWKFNRYQVSALLFVALMLCGPLARAGDPPNVLLFLTDDESWLEHRLYGWSKLPTPNFDRVAQAGVLFTNGYTSAPSCAPSRASLLTGRNFWELKQGALIQAWLPKEFPVFPQLLEQHGYLTGRCGKGWGPGVTPAVGHDADMAGKAIPRRVVEQRIPQISPVDYAAGFDAFLKSRKPEQPFFFWAGLTEPHGPYDKENFRRLEQEFGVTLDQIPLPPTMNDTPQARKARANFFYEVLYADRQLGRMLDSLEAAGALSNTLVIVTSDNGTAIPQGKASPYDWGVHEPLAMMWPAQVPAGRTVTDFVSFPDFAPTILEAAGIPVPSEMSGRSFLPVLKSKQSGRVDASRNFVVTGLEWHGEFDPESRSSRTIRNDRFEYIVRYRNVDAQGQQLTPQQAIVPVRTEFYDLEHDPWQRHDLSNDPAFAAEKKQLAEQLENFTRRTHDPRVTGKMETFQKTRQFVQERKRNGYSKELPLPE